MGYGRYSHSKGTKEEQGTPGIDIIGNVILFIQDIFKFNRTDKIVAIILAALLLIGHLLK